MLGKTRVNQRDKKNQSMTMLMGIALGQEVGSTWYARYFEKYIHFSVYRILFRLFETLKVWIWSLKCISPESKLPGGPIILCA